jgi:hypothetical protein
MELRAALSSIDLLTVASGMTALGINPQTCKSLEDAKLIADSFVQSTDERPLDRLKFALIVLGLPPRAEPFLAAEWEKAGFKPLIEYSPFAAHVLTVELFFQIALAANLISTQDVNNRTDISYLFYLPFCMLFVSSDRLHQHVAPLFMRPDQLFVWGQDLKGDLRRLVEYYIALPEAQKEEGIFAFARTPPKNDTGLVSQLWDRCLRPWRDSVQTPERDPLKDEAILKELKRLINRPAVPAHEIDGDSEDVAMMTVQSRVRIQRGSFRMFSKEIEEAERKRKTERTGDS